MWGQLSVAQRVNLQEFILVLATALATATAAHIHLSLACPFLEPQGNSFPGILSLDLIT